MDKKLFSRVGISPHQMHEEACFQQALGGGASIGDWFEGMLLTALVQLARDVYGVTTATQEEFLLGAIAMSRQLAGRLEQVLDEATSPEEGGEIDSLLRDILSLGAREKRSNAVDDGVRILVQNARLRVRGRE